MIAAHLTVLRAAAILGGTYGFVAAWTCVLLLVARLTNKEPNQ